MKRWIQHAAIPIVLILGLSGAHAAEELPDRELMAYAAQEAATGNCPARDGETQKECRERLSKKKTNRQVDWDAPQEEGSEDHQFKMPLDGSDSAPGGSGYDAYGRPYDRAENPSDCPARAGETQRECQDRLRGKKSDRQVDWDAPKTEDDENHQYGDPIDSAAPYRNEYSYDGKQGWEIEEGDCAARPGESQRECHARLRGKKTDRQVDWNISQEEDEDIRIGGSRPGSGMNEALPFNDVYSGVPGDSPSEQKPGSRTNRQVDWELPQEEEDEDYRFDSPLDPGAPYSGGRDYDGRPGWEIEEGDCPARPGESQSECYARVRGEKTDRQVDWEIPQGEDEEPQFGDYRDPSGYGQYGEECSSRNPRVQAGCEARRDRRQQNADQGGGQRGYQPDFNTGGDTPFGDIYSGIPGSRNSSGGTPRYSGGVYNGSGEGSSAGPGTTAPGYDADNPYAGIPGSDGSEDPAANRGGGLEQDSRFDYSDYLNDSQQGDLANGGIGGNGGGSFGGYGGGGAAGPGGGYNFVDLYNTGAQKEEDYSDLYKEKEDPNWTKVLLFCHLQIPFEGVSKVFKDKTCRKSIRKMCSFKISKRKISGPSTCGSFAPWRM